VGLLAKRACAEFGWGASSRVLLHLVKLGGKLPTPEEEAAAAPLDDPSAALADAGIVKGAWLIARVSLPAAAVGTSCGARTFYRRRPIPTLFSGLALALSTSLPARPPPPSTQAVQVWYRVRSRLLLLAYKRVRVLIFHASPPSRLPDVCFPA